jgi:hypothetical protein
MLVASDLQKSGTYFALGFYDGRRGNSLCEIIKIPVRLASFVLVKHRLIQEIGGLGFKVMD